MISVRSIVSAQQKPPENHSMRELASAAGLTHDASLGSALRALEQPLVFHTQITTPAGTALGGTADILVARDGTYAFDVHLHDSGFDPYDVKVRAAVTTPSGLTLVFQCSGHTDGTGSDPFGSPDRDFDHHERGVNRLAELYWYDVRRGSVDVSKSYEDSGLLSVAEDVAKGLLAFVVADLTLGAGLALVVCCSAELSNAFDGNFAGPGGLVGVIVAGGIAWAWGPSAILASVAGGLFAGAITDAIVDHRTLTEDEYAFAQIVFGDTLPARERIYVTNLSSDGGRAYTWPNVDHSILLNLNLAYDDPVHYKIGSREKDTPDPYAVPGSLFIHEMTHAWQIRAGDFVPGLVCTMTTRTRSYDTAPAKAWGDLGLEQQAASVDHWFSESAEGWTTVDDLKNRLAAPAALSNRFFPYIANHIRLGVD